MHKICLVFANLSLSMLINVMLIKKHVLHYNNKNTLFRHKILHEEFNGGKLSDFFLSEFNMVMDTIFSLR